MTDKKKGPVSLASELDKTHWDHQPRKDRGFLLAPLARLLGSVVWEFRPRHLRPAAVNDEPEIERETTDAVENASTESADRPNRRR